MNTSNEDKQKDKLANHPVGKENDHPKVLAMSFSKKNCFITEADAHEDQRLGDRT